MKLYRRLKRAYAEYVNDFGDPCDLLNYETDWVDDDETPEEELIRKLKDEHNLPDGSWFVFGIQYKYESCEEDIKRELEAKSTWEWVDINGPVLLHFIPFDKGMAIIDGKVNKVTDDNKAVNK